MFLDSTYDSKVDMQALHETWLTDNNTAIIGELKPDALPLSLW